MNNIGQAQAWNGCIFSAGWKTARGGTEPVVEPATGEKIGTIGIGSAEDIDSAAVSASKAQKAWAGVPFDERAAIMREAACLLKERAQEINDWNVRECGSTRPKAAWELHATYEQLQMAASLPTQPDGALYPSTIPGRTNICRHVPVGTIGVIAPWNFPILLGMRSLAPALALGNAVILKPDAQSAVAGGLLLARIFEDAGLPNGACMLSPAGQRQVMRLYGTRRSE